MSFALARVIWPDPVGGPTPAPALIPFFILLAVGESLAFGLGIAFLVFGLPLLRRARQPGWLTAAAFLSTAWLLLSWWPHDNLHRVNGDNLGGLLGIEYGFHATLEIVCAILALFFIRVVLAERTAVVAVGAPAATLSAERPPGRG